MKKVITAVFILIVLTACSVKKDWGDPVKLAQDAVTCGAFEEPLALLDDSELGFDLYLLDFAKYEQGIFWLSTGASAEEFVYMKAKDAAAYEAAVTAAKKRVEYQISIFESYAPNDVAKLNNAKVITDKSQLVVIYIVANDYGKLPEMLR